MLYGGKVLSPGKAEGVVSSLEGSGEIIVARRITPLDSLKVVNAKGVIVEDGRTLSHIAICTKELGIPCIRLLGATKLIPVGSRVKIYENGRVEKLS